MDKKRIAVVFGGCSPEYSVSLESASAVIKHIDTEKYELVMLGINKGGEWFRYCGDVSKIIDNTWQSDRSICVPAIISPDRGLHGIVEFRMAGVRTTKLDAVFPVLHGKHGEDGTLQGLCELAGLPIIGCGALASALCMDKDRAHRVASLNDVEVPKAVVVTRAGTEAELTKAVEGLTFPLFVKPVRAGSSFGVTRVKVPAGLRDAVKLALRFDREVIIEDAISGFEVGCAVMGNDELTVGTVDEIEIQGDLFDFEEKYTLKTSKIHMPARIDSDTALRVQDTAKRIYRALGCRGFARVDMFLTPEGRIVFNEVNTIPGFTSHSRYPNMMNGINIKFGELVDRLIELGLEQ